MKDFEKFIEDNYKGVGFEITKITETGNYEFAYLKGNDNYDVPILVKNKKTNEIKDEIVPPFTNSDGEKVIWEKGKDKQKEDNKIKELFGV